jgi:mono/diheme cytochrome c family protein
MLHCRGCHGPDGSGAVGAVPSFREHVAKFARVAGGREYLIRVPGTAQSELDDARIAALLNWILAEFSAAEVPPNFAPFTAEEVAHHRRQPLTNPDLVRLELTRAIESLDNEQKVP